MMQNNGPVPIPFCDDIFFCMDRDEAYRLGRVRDALAYAMALCDMRDELERKVAKLTTASPHATKGDA